MAHGDTSYDDLGSIVPRKLTTLERSKKISESATRAESRPFATNQLTSGGNFR